MLILAFRQGQKQDVPVRLSGDEENSVICTACYLAIKPMLCYTKDAIKMMIWGDEMNLKAFKLILIVGFLLMAACIIITSITKRAIFGYIGFAAAVLTLVLGLIFNRCPYCGHFLGRASGKYCPGCGSKLER